MIAWIISIISAILLFFIVWRKVSRKFRERCELPKFLFLKNLDAFGPTGRVSTQTQASQENHHGSNHS